MFCACFHSSDTCLKWERAQKVCVFVCVVWAQNGEERSIPRADQDQCELQCSASSSRPMAHIRSHRGPDYIPVPQSNRSGVSPCLSTPQSRPDSSVHAGIEQPRMVLIVKVMGVQGWDHHCVTLVVDRFSFSLRSGVQRNRLASAMP